MALGALCAAVGPLLRLSQGLFGTWMQTPYLVVITASQPLLLVGLLGVATAVWRAGRRGAGAALLGAPLVVPPLMSFVIVTIHGSRDDISPAVGFALAVATVLASVAAAMTGPRTPAPRPGWLVSAGGAVAGAAPVVFPLWRGPVWSAGESVPLGDYDTVMETYYAEVGQHLLVVGPVVAGIALLAGLLAGPRVLVTGTAAGLLLGASAALLGPGAAYLGDNSTGGVALLAILALTAGVAAARSRARTVVGVAGLGVVAGWLLVLWPASGPEVLGSTTIGLMLATLAAATVPVLASLGTVLAPAGAAPAAFAGVAAGVSVGVAGVVHGLAYTAADAEARGLGVHLPAVVLLVAVVGLTVFAHRRWGRTDLEPVTVG